MTSKTARVMTIKSLTLLCVLLLAACDGGIFGTGSGDSATMDNSVGVIGDNASATDTEAPNTTPPTPDGNDENVTAGAGATGSTATAGTAGTAGSTATAGDTDAGTDGAIPSTGDQDTGGTTGGTTGGATGGDTGGDSTNADTSTSGDGGVMSGENLNSNIASTDKDGEFLNNTPTLPSDEAKVLMVNMTARTLNMIESSVQPATLLFDNAGVAPGTSSASAALTNNATSLTIVDNSAPSQALISYPQFDVDESTFTTLLIRDDGSDISAVALATETNTTDPTLAKIRVVQAGTLGNASLETQVFIRSAGDNPGGIDITFGPLSFDNPESDYSELRAADYEIIDAANRFIPFALTLNGDDVYTVLLVGNGTNDIVVINDTVAAELTP